MNLNDVAKSFGGGKRGTGIERHSIKSLSRRLLLSRQTVRKALKSGEMEFSAKFGVGANTSYEFPSARLDAMRESIVEEIIHEICARLQGLDMTEQEMVLAALHGLRAHKADVETEFSSKPSTDDDDDDEHEVARLIGAGVGGGAGAAIGGRLIGGIAGRITGAAIGSAAGDSIGGTDLGPDIAAAGIGAGIGYGAHKLIQNRGGYAAVAEAAAPAVKEAGGRMLAALRRALARSAAKAV
jgi:hypothetical protein